jgi:hypothetical protein
MVTLGKRCGIGSRGDGERIHPARCHQAGDQSSGGTFESIYKREYVLTWVQLRRGVRVVEVTPPERQPITATPDYDERKLIFSFFISPGGEAKERGLAPWP